MTGGDAFAQSAAQTSFNVPAGPLGRVLTAFGRQAGLQVTYLTSIGTGKTSPGISGPATREQALARILQGTGLSYHFTNATTVAISQPAAAGGAGAAPAGRSRSIRSMCRARPRGVR
ncbi:secretin and TonB N-terminal domain-containing protein [Nitrobacter winogradskyi]